jgi:hypothetical protein
MPLCTYYNDVENFKKVSDPDINDLLQEVRSIDNRYYIREHEYLENRGWFFKPKTRKYYSILYHIHSTEYQELNLCNDGFDVYPNSSIVAAYLIGFLNGNRKSVKQ